ncbi:SRPBCC domain-containing protein [Herbidospora mongoliensis]|uniref:SRPBCC domain-containing protein n=1 Tax=Herbidospora mongoliensis TaxID=688067 RepID=UPI00083305BD|nr:SRPBCC domain-containing protein [Herbidospora mongoliensis]
MIDIAWTSREVTRDDETVAVVLRRDFGSPVDDVWDALTDPERLKRWFLPVSGDLRAGGTFTTEGGAGGAILACEKPFLQFTYGGETSVVTVRLSAREESTTLELTHTVPVAMAQSGAGALWVGPGWDEAYLALELFLDGKEAQGQVTPEYGRATVAAWVAAVETSGTATAEEIETARQMAVQQYVAQE